MREIVYLIGLLLLKYNSYNAILNYIQKESNSG